MTFGFSFQAWINVMAMQKMTMWHIVEFANKYRIGYIVDYIIEILYKG
jgi:hypothetical protein